LRGGILRVVEMLLLELEQADALLAVGFGFCGAVRVDAAFGEEIGASAGDDEGGPAVAMGLLVIESSFLVQFVAGCRMNYFAHNAEATEGRIA